MCWCHSFVSTPRFFMLKKICSSGQWGSTPDRPTPLSSNFFAPLYTGTSQHSKSVLRTCTLMAGWLNVGPFRWGAQKLILIRSSRALTDKAVPYLGCNEKLVCVSLLEKYIESKVWEAGVVVLRNNSFRDFLPMHVAFVISFYMDKEQVRDRFFLPDILTQRNVIL